MRTLSHSFVALLLVRVFSRQRPIQFFNDLVEVITKDLMHLA